MVVAATDGNNNALTALITAALSLPGIAAHAAEGGYRAEQSKVTVQHAEYEESNQRMDIKTDQISAVLPVGERFEVGFNAIRDMTSGASPVVNFLDKEGKPHQFLETGASIQDRRDIYEGTLGYYGDRNYGGIKIGESTEDDYESIYASIDFRRSYNNKATTLSLGAAYNDDRVWNSYNPAVLLEEPTVYNTREKQEWMAGISQVINRNTVVQFNLTFSHSSGSLSDPYKKSYVVDEGLFDYRGILDIAGMFRFLVDAGVIRFLNESGITELLNESPQIDIPWLSSSLFGIVKDNRPSQRDQWISMVRVSHYFAPLDAALHTDYRYAQDEWQADSHTLETKLNIDLGLGIQLSPGLRYYTQESAFFYDTFFESIPADGYISSDYRLAEFGALSKKLELSVLITPDITATASYENYDRKYDYAWGGTGKGNDIDDFRAQMLSVSIDGRF